MFTTRMKEQVLPDPVLSEIDLPLKVTLYPLGLPLELSTNSAHVIDAACEAWSAFPQAFEETPMRLCLGVADDGSRPAASRSEFRSRDHLMSIQWDTRNFVFCDFSQSYAFGWVSHAVAEEHALLRYHLLDAAVLCMAEQQSLAPLHAGLVARNRRGVAFLGESLAGKSTLSYACARAGWNYVSDDGVFLVRDREDRYAIGNPYTIRFRVEAKRLFPELADGLASARPNGKLGIELGTRELSIAPARGCTIDHLVFLDRNQRGPAELRPYPEADAQAFLERFVTYGASHVRAAQLRCYRRLAGVPVWKLSYNDFDGAIERLDELIESDSPAGQPESRDAVSLF